jgi:hypothetical protein
VGSSSIGGTVGGQFQGFVTGASMFFGWSGDSGCKGNVVRVFVFNRVLLLLWEAVDCWFLLLKMFFVSLMAFLMAVFVSFFCF